MLTLLSQVKEWLQEIGIYVLEGECHWTSIKPNNPTFQPSSIPILSIMQDRLRNGLILCDLVMILEPSAARHISLARCDHIYIYIYMCVCVCVCACSIFAASLILHVFAIGECIGRP